MTSCADQHDDYDDDEKGAWIECSAGTDLKVGQDWEDHQDRHAKDETVPQFGGRQNRAAESVQHFTCGKQ